MTDFTNRTPASTYKDILQVPNSNAGIDGTLRAVEDGESTASPLELSTSAVNVSSGFQLGGNAVQTPLEALGQVTPAADKLPYFTGASAATVTDLTAAGRALIDDANAAAQRTTLGLGALATLSSVTASEIDANAVGSSEIAANAVGSSEIAAGAVGTSELDATTQPGKAEIWVPAQDMKPTVSNGCATLAQVETTAGRPDIIALDFDQTTAEFAQFSIAFPKKWDEGTITAQFYWTHSAGTAFVCRWGLQGVAVADGDTIDIPNGTDIYVNDTGGTNEDLYISAETAAITIAGTPAAGELVFFRAIRDAGNVADTLDADGRLIGVKVIYTTDAHNDD